MAEADPLGVPVRRAGGQKVPQAGPVGSGYHREHKRHAGAIPYFEHRYP